MGKWLGKWWGHLIAGAVIAGGLFIAWLKARGMVNSAVDAEVDLAEKHSDRTAEDAEHAAKETRHHAADETKLDTMEADKSIEDEAARNPPGHHIRKLFG